MAKNHHTKDKGDLRFLKAIAEMCSQGYTILVPMTEHATYDCVIEKDGKFKRVQCKYRSLDKTGTINIQFKSSWADRNGTHVQKIDKKNVDIYAIYCPDVEKVFFIEPEMFDTSVTIRVKNPKNNQKANVRIADDYLLVP